MMRAPFSRQRPDAGILDFVIVAGLFLALSWAMAAFNINPFAAFGWITLY
ncbi:hypothetical protein [Eggerthella sinensis]|nr:hypothetical protein [Eggerthella sinensis]